MIVPGAALWTIPHPHRQGPLVEEKLAGMAAFGVEFKPVNTVWMKNFAVFVKSNSEKETQASP